MSADTGTRDAAVAEDIAAAEDVVSGLTNRLASLIIDATGHGAAAHAELYEEVLGHLIGAEKRLHRAHAVMLNGDPDGVS